MSVQKTLISNLIPTGGIAESKYIDDVRTVSTCVGLDLFKDVGYVKSALKLTQYNQGSWKAIKFLDINISAGSTRTIVYDANGYARWNASGTLDGYYAPSFYTLSGRQNNTSFFTANAVADYQGFHYLANQLGLFRFRDVSATTVVSEYVGDVAVSASYGSDTATGYSYTTAINEGATHKFSFVATSDKVIYVTFKCKTMGTADSFKSLYVVVHDASNNVLATFSGLKDSFTAGSYYSCYMPALYNSLKVGTTYHIHMYTTDGTGTAGTSIANDLSGADIKLEMASSPVMYTLNNVLYVASGRYIHQVEVVSGSFAYSTKVLDIGDNGDITSLGSFGTDLVVGTSKGVILRWNTYSVTWTFATEPINASINSMWTFDNQTYCNAGNNGDIYIFTGSSLVYFTKIFNNENARGIVSLVYPYTKYVLLAVSAGNSGAGSSDATLKAATNEGLYAFGSIAKNSSPVVSLLNPLSGGVNNGNYISGLSGSYIGWMAFNGGNANTDYRIDKYDSSSYLLSGAYYETKIIKIDRSSFAEIIEVLVPYVSLPTSTNIKLYYKVNYASSWTEITGFVDTKRMLKSFPFSIQGSVFEFKVELITNNTDSPSIESLIIKYE